MANNVIKEITDYVDGIMSNDSRQPTANEIYLAKAVCEMDFLMETIKILMASADKRMRWMAFSVKEDYIPDDGVIFVRIADNVLDEGDWPVQALKIQCGTVITQRDILPGVYTVVNMVGWTKAKLVNWANFDPTGSHPEVYHEVAIIE